LDHIWPISFVILETLNLADIFHLNLEAPRFFPAHSGKTLLKLRRIENIVI